MNELMGALFWFFLGTLSCWVHKQWRLNKLSDRIEDDSDLMNELKRLRQRLDDLEDK